MASLLPGLNRPLINVHLMEEKPLWREPCSCVLSTAGDRPQPSKKPVHNRRPDRHFGAWEHWDYELRARLGQGAKTHRRWQRCSHWAESCRACCDVPSGEEINHTTELSRAHLSGSRTSMGSLVCSHGLEGILVSPSSRLSPDLPCFPFLQLWQLLKYTWREAAPV